MESLQRQVSAHQRTMNSSGGGKATHWRCRGSRTRTASWKASLCGATRWSGPRRVVFVLLTHQSELARSDPRDDHERTRTRAQTHASLEGTLVLQAGRHAGRTASWAKRSRAGLLRLRHICAAHHHTHSLSGAGIIMGAIYRDSTNFTSSYSLTSHYTNNLGNRLGALLIIVYIHSPHLVFFYH